MKALTKKVVAVVLALCMCFALCCTAFAASSEDTQGSITINGAIANETYTIYQIFELTYTSDETGANTGESYSYKVADEWKSFIEGYSIDGVNDGGQVETVNLFTLTENGYLEPTSAIYDYEDNTDVVAAFARAALAYAEQESIEGTASASFAWSDEYNTYVVSGVATIGSVTIDENGYATTEMTFSNLSLGYYLVGTSLGSLCMLDSTDPNAVVNEKNSTPVISKHVYNTADDNWELEDHEDNGSTVTYELDVEHITGAVNLVIHDSQPSELEEDWDNFHPEVTLVDGETRTSLTENVNYTIVLTGTSAVDETTGEPLDAACSDEAFDEAYGCTFEIDFTGYDFSNVSEDAYIEVIYTATLNTEGDIYTDDFDEIDNWAVVTFGTSSTSPIVEAEVYSFGFEIFKYTEVIPGYSEVIVVSYTNDNPDNATWQDELYLMCIDENGNVTNYATFEPYDETNNIYIITGWVNEEDQASYVSEPENGDTEVHTAYFYVPTGMEIPEHTLIQLDEDAENASQETNDGAEIVSATDYGVPLANAVFEVTREVTETDETTSETTTSTQTAYFLEETIYADDGETVLQHIYLLEGWLAKGESLPEDSSYTTSVTSASDGMIYIEGLDTGTYTVTEIAAPDGYNLLDDSITVTIWAEYDEASGSITDHGVTWTLGENGEEETGVINVVNNAGTELPGTGGMGVYIFYIIGGCLVVAAAVVLITRRRMTR